MLGLRVRSMIGVLISLRALVIVEGIDLGFGRFRLGGGRETERGRRFG